MMAEMMLAEAAAAARQHRAHPAYSAFCVQMQNTYTRFSIAFLFNFY